MRRSLLHGLPACVLVGIVCLAVAGCWNPFAPPGGGDPPPSQVQYKLRTTPENVVYNLNSAYKDMNLEEYLACLAENFEFVLNPNDVNDPMNDLPESWGKTEEEAIHARMFADTTNVGNIDLTLTNVSSQWDQGADPVDPSDDTWIHVDTTDLRVTIGEWTYLANADQEFVFQIDPNETGPSGQTLWEIVIWTDLLPQPGRAIHDENTQRLSVGRIKALFR
jgi:hypothetical protein